jgi:hypothetical protein
VGEWPLADSDKGKEPPSREQPEEPVIEEPSYYGARVKILIQDEAPDKRYKVYGKHTLDEYSRLFVPERFALCHSVRLLWR